MEIEWRRAESTAVSRADSARGALGIAADSAPTRAEGSEWPAPPQPIKAAMAAEERRAHTDFRPLTVTMILVEDSDRLASVGRRGRDLATGLAPTTWPHIVEL